MCLRTLLEVFGGKGIFVPFVQSFCPGVTSNHMGQQTSWPAGGAGGLVLKVTPNQEGWGLNPLAGREEGS